MKSSNLCCGRWPRWFVRRRKPIFPRSCPLSPVCAVPIHFPELHKVLKTLKTLGLLVTVRLHPDNVNSQDDAYDLHPLVRQFIRETSSQQQRRGFIEPIVRHYKKKIEQFKVYLVGAPTMVVLENWTHKVELEINFGAHDQALVTLWEVRKAMLVAGYYEEYVRVASRLFNELNWKDAMGRSVTHLMIRSARSLNAWFIWGAPKMLMIISTDMVVFPPRTHRTLGTVAFEVMRTGFAVTTSWRSIGQTRGHELKVTTKADTDHGCLLHLALAERDAGMVDSALARFLGGVTVEQATDAVLLPGKDYSFYGNIGRCLCMKGDVDRAMTFYKRSALLLEDDESALAPINQGYARSWIAEALVSRGELELAYYFMRSAIFRWRRVAPPRAKAVEGTIAELRERLQPFEVFAGTTDDEIERRCRRWIRG